MVPRFACPVRSLTARQILAASTIRSPDATAPAQHDQVDRYGGDRGAAGGVGGECVRRGRLRLFADTKWRGTVGMPLPRLGDSVESLAAILAW